MAAAPGRPRRFSEEEEIRLLLDAATAVMRRNAYEAATVQDILDEAGLSSRAFYRHFQSKDDLVRALLRREAEAAARSIEGRVSAAGSPREGLEEWLDALLGFAFDARRARRVGMLRSEVGRKASGYPEEQRYARELTMAPLVAVLGAGQRDGSFPRAVPEHDAMTIHAMTSDLWQSILDGHVSMTRQEALDHLLRFALPALGWSAR